MYYSNFDTHITDKYGIKLLNWPLDRFCSPSDITSRAELDVLKNAFTSGMTQFYRMTSAELEEWREKRFEETIKSRGDAPINNDTADPSPSTNDDTSSHPAPSLDPNPTNPAPTQTPQLSLEQPSIPFPIDPALLLEDQHVMHEQQPHGIPDTHALAGPSTTQAPVPVGTGSRKRGWASLADTNTICFIQTDTVTGSDGHVVLQKQGHQSKKRGESGGKGKGKRNRIAAHE
ncbi:hypothetical protein VKT23_016661 [Stygiomarasmius scandens]|uniref:Uncharacterized protein n=1 Tax=Marasmiellus scandens TaxID=2682957 RepID=A0ABR1IUD8_9AGAR